MTHIRLSDAAVGSIINIPINGKICEFILVHSGNPNSAIYDASCSGVWLLGKECCKEDSWGSDQNIYERSSARTSAAQLGGTATRNGSTARLFIIWSAHIAASLLKAMGIKIGNTAPGAATMTPGGRRWDDGVL